VTTSGTYSFSVSRDDLVREAMLNIRKLDAYSTIDPVDLADVVRKLNMMVKQWMTKQDFAPGLKMWQRQRSDLFLSSTKGQYALGPSGDNWAAGVSTSTTKNYQSCQLTANTAASSATLTVGTTAVANFTVADNVVVVLDSGDTFSSTVASKGASTVVLNAVLPSSASSNAYVFNYTTKGQRPTDILTCLLRDTNGSDTPIDRMTVEVYEALTNKTQPGFVADPTLFYYEQQLTNGQLYIDCAGAQDCTKVLHFVYLRPIQDITNPTDNPEYSAEWYNALAWGLAKQIAPMFKANWDQTMETNFQDALAMAKESSPDSTQTFFQCHAEDF